MATDSDFDWHEYYHGEFGVTRALFGGQLSPSEFEGNQLILKECFDAGLSIDQTAYVLATAYHETARTMRPVRETLAKSDESAMRILERAWKEGKLKWVKTPYWRDGWFGRGFVQLTHEYNYKGPLRDAVKARFGQGYDIWEDPSLLIRSPKVSAYVLVEGMIRGDTLESDFTSYPLEDFVNADKRDYLGARKSVNPGDRSSYHKIAGEAETFRQALMEALR